MISRRQFIRGSVLAAGGLVLFNSVYFEPRRLKLERVEVGIKGLPSEFDGFTICQITDVHHGPFVTLGYVDRVVEIANTQRADLTVLTGDYVYNGSRYLPPAIKSFASLRARYGIAAVLGNHDHYADAALAEELIEEHGIRYLRNSHMLINKDDSAICIGGVKDLYEDEPNVVETFSGVEKDITRVLLSHNPDYAEMIPGSERVDLVLSGHTHGGQVRLVKSYAPIVPSIHGQKYSGGLVHLKQTQVYVSRGIGSVIIPVRFNCPPELTLIKLKRMDGPVAT